MTTYSNLTRFQPRVASLASGSPLRRWQRSVAEVMEAKENRRCLPRVDPSTKLPSGSPDKT
jgi:hypothetical protein